MKVIADTNVWYELGSSRKLLKDIVPPGYSLYATPTSFFEIVAGIGPQTFEERRLASRAVLNYSKGIVNNTERYFAQLYGLTNEDDDVPWREGFEAISNAKTMEELIGGVPLKTGGKKLAVLLDTIRDWKQIHWGGFKTQVEEAIESRLPGYKGARAKGNCIYMDQRKGLLFQRELMKPEAFISLYRALYERTKLYQSNAPKSVDDLDRAILLKSFEALYSYMTIYFHYIFKCATKYAPEDNDFGDLECFAYAQDDNLILTFDKRWIGNAIDSGLERYLVSKSI